MGWREKSSLKKFSPLDTGCQGIVAFWSSHMIDLPLFTMLYNCTALRQYCCAISLHCGWWCNSIALERIRKNCNSVVAEHVQYLRWSLRARAGPRRHSPFRWPRPSTMTSTGAWLRSCKVKTSLWGQYAKFFSRFNHSIGMCPIWNFNRYQINFAKNICFVGHEN